MTMQTRSQSSRSPPSSVEEISEGRAAEDIPGSKAFWTPQDEAALITFFQTKKTNEKVSTASLFKRPSFVEAAAVLNSSRLKGGVKTAQACQSKWTQVCIPLVHVFTCILTYTSR